MNINEIATKHDIENLINSIEQLKALIEAPKMAKKFLRSLDVRKLLSISDGTLQRLRITNTLPAQKVNGTWFYKYEDVLRMIEKK